MDSGKTVLTIVSGDSSNIYLLCEKEQNITGCSNRRYFVIEKYYKYFTYEITREVVFI